MNEVNITIGKGIALQRLKQHLTQQELAEKVSEITGEHISTNMISSWERGITEISARMSMMLAKALNCSTYNFFPHSELVTGIDIELATRIRNLSSREKEIILHMIDSDDVDSRTFWEFALLYFVLPEWWRKIIAKEGIDVYKEAKNCDETSEDDLEVNIDIIIQGWKKLKG